MGSLLNKSERKSQTTNIHIGSERYTLLAQLAIDISNETRVPFTGSQLLKYLIDKYAKTSVGMVVKELKKEN